MSIPSNTLTSRTLLLLSLLTFDMICDELGFAIAKEDTMLRATIPIRHHVAVGKGRHGGEG